MLLDTVLTSRRTVWFAAACSLALGLFFIFVWSPLPFGWRGIDGYHELGVAVARGEPFPTMHLMWGYAHVLGLCYRLFGERVWVPLVVQAALNALVPLMLYRHVRLALDRRAAVTAALLTGVVSFNTVYVSILASDAICTVLFVAALLAFEHGVRSGRLGAFVAAGVLMSVAYHFRPNLVLFPFLVCAVYLLARPRHRTKAGQVAIVLTAFAVVATPWIVRNYRLTGRFIPASTHGAVQLWYGTLQTGPYLHSRALNPRSVFEGPVFEYTSLDDLSVVVEAHLRPGAPDGAEVQLVYWTARRRIRVRLEPAERSGRRRRFIVPPQPAPTTVFYFFETRGRSPEGRTVTQATPLAGADAPRVFFVSHDHLGDMDRDGVLLDAFDVVRLLRHLRWAEPVPVVPRLDLDSNGRTDVHDLDRAVALLVASAVPSATHVRRGAVRAVTDDRQTATMTLSDGSTFGVPRTSTGRITDVLVSGGLAEGLLFGRVSVGNAPQADGVDPRLVLEDIRVNDVFYRRNPQALARYTALARDNIRRDPLAYAASCLFRMVRVFVVVGTDDPRTTHQFARGRIIFAAATVASAVLFALLVAGVGIAIRRRYRLLTLLTPVVYIPLTLGFVLTNMRYSVTVQPYVFVFVSIALLALLEKLRLVVRAGPATSTRR